MRKAALLAGFTLILLSVKTLSAQTNITNDYVIVSIGDVANPADYAAAMDIADWEPYRLQNSRYALSFDSGVAIELKSAVEMLNLGYPINITNYPTSLPSGYVPPTLHLFSGNKIGMMVSSPVSKQVQAQQQQ